MPYHCASVVVIHYEVALYQVYAPLILESLVLSVVLVGPGSCNLSGTGIDKMRPCAWLCSSIDAATYVFVASRVTASRCRIKTSWALAHWKERN